MSYRYMRIMLFFDLPSVSNLDHKAYQKFRKFLDCEGFIQMQESVYTKLALNSSISKAVIKKIRANAPKKGLVQVLVVTEKQFSQMEFIVGTHVSLQIDNEERLIIL